MKTLAIIGSTGSIGRSSLNILKKNKNKFKLIYISCEKNYSILKKQFKEFKPTYIGINKNYYSRFKSFKKIKTLNFLLKKKIKIDYVISGVSGFESLDLNFKLIKISKNLLIANKETIICGGHIFLNEAKKNNCNILPIDSEHYCINYFLNNFKFNLNSINKIILMASGGPFLNKKIKYKEKISNVLKHPNWKMGKKISVDSSNMSNKVLELFEAKILFKLKNSLLDIKIENKSIVHAIISLKNNLSFLVSHNTSMEIPISNSLNLKNINNNNFLINNFKINKVNNSKFPLVKLGFKILGFGPAGMILFTVLNERLVNLYLKKVIFYGDISTKLINLFKKNEIVKMSKKCIKTKSDIIKIINFAKKLNI